MSNLPDGPLRRMWARAGIVSSVPAPAPPPPESKPLDRTTPAEASAGNVGTPAADAGASSKENVPPSRASAADAEPAVDASDPRADVAPTSDSSDDSDADADAGAAYEREREARIARNRERMRSLGIDAMGRRIGDASDGAGKRPARRPRGSARAKASRPAPTQPTRRSTRAARRAGVVIDDVSSDVLAALGETDDALVVARASQSAAARPAHAPVHEAIELETFDDSSVRRYACRAAPSPPRDGGSRRARDDQSVVGFVERGDVVFVDSSVKKGFYSLDATRDGALLVGGGDGGRVSIFAAGEDDEDDEDDGREREADDEDDGLESEARPRNPRVSAPLMSWAAHRGWCSQVQFADESRTSLGVEGLRSVSAPPAVFSAGGMDGAVSLWDVSVAGVATGRPAEIARADDLHAGGIFSAHVARGPSSRDGAARVLTGSKDASACVSRWGGSGAGAGGHVVERRVDGAHVGVVRCVRWREDFRERNADVNIFASCGVDGAVCVMDARARRALVAKIDDAHGGRPVNFVEWACALGDDAGGLEHAVLTAGMDRVVRAWDVRHARRPTREETTETRDDAWDGPDESPFARVAAERARGPRPATTMEGHAAPSSSRPKMMYHPVFVPGGARGPAVATPGEGSKRLSLYSAADGKAVSRGDVGFDATAVFARRSGGGGGWTLALADRGEVRLYEQTWG